MNRKYNKVKIQNLLKKREIQLISDYTSYGKKHTWKCSTCEHTWVAFCSNVLKGSGCPKCAGQCQSVETMYELAKSCGLEFLSTSYETMKTKYKWGCPNGHFSLIAADKVKSGVRCSMCHRGIKEEECRFIFEKMTKCKFIPSRIENLELNGYCEELNLAFEYNGKQHYEFMPFFHKSYEEFQNQITRDKIKTRDCRKNSITKLDIPYYKAIDRESLAIYIMEFLNRSNCLVQNNINWDKFHGKRKFLEETSNSAKKISVVCLSNVYIDAKTKMPFKCLICDNLWETTPDTIKHGRGCPKCGYVKRVKSRRATLLRKKLHPKNNG